MIKNQINLNKNQHQKSKETKLGLLTLTPKREVEKVVDEGRAKRRWWLAAQAANWWPEGLLQWWRNSSTVAVGGHVWAERRGERVCDIYFFYLA